MSASVVVLVFSLLAGIQLITTQNVSNVEEPLALTPKLEEALQTGNLKPIEINPNLFLFLVNATSGETIESLDAINGPQNILVANALPLAGQNLHKLEPKVMELSLSTNSPQAIVGENLPFFAADSSTTTNNASAELFSNPFLSSPYQSNTETINSLIQNIFSNVTLESLPPTELLFGSLPEGNITEVKTIFDTVAPLDENNTSRVIFSEETSKDNLQPLSPPVQPIVKEKEEVSQLQRATLLESTGNIKDQPVEETAGLADANLKDIGKWKPLTSEEASSLSQQNVNVHANLVTPLTAREKQTQVVSSIQNQQTIQLQPAVTAQAVSVTRDIPVAPVAPVRSPSQLPPPPPPHKLVTKPLPKFAPKPASKPAPVHLHQQIRAQPIVPTTTPVSPAAPVPLKPVNNLLQEVRTSSEEQSPPPNLISSNILESLRQSLPAGVNLAEIPIYVLDNSQLGWAENEETVFSNDGLQVNIPPQLLTVQPQQVLQTQPAPVSQTNAQVVNDIPQVIDILRLPKLVPALGPVSSSIVSSQPVTPLPLVKPAPRKQATKSKAAFGSSAFLQQSPMKEILAKFQELMNQKKNQALVATSENSAPSSSSSVDSSFPKATSPAPLPVVPVSTNNRMNTNRQNILATSITSRQARDSAPVVTSSSSTSTRGTTNVNDLFIESAADLVNIISLPNFKFYLGKRDGEN